MIRYIILFLLSVVIITANGKPNLQVCNLQTAQQAIPPRIFFEQTIDGPTQPIIFTRFIHNKFGVFGSEFSKCYFSVLDPNFILSIIGIIGLVFWLYFIYIILSRKSFLPILIFFLLPTLPFFFLPIIIISYAFKIFAIIGLIFFLIGKK